MKSRPGFLSATGAVSGAAALAIIVAWVLFGGAGMFSTGELNAAVRGPALGGVTSHAALGADCGACHTAPWDERTMADRCMACHRDVDTQVRGRTGLHGGMVGGTRSRTCRPCHFEHRGPNGALTVDFDHDKVPFRLLGKHASVPCGECHKSPGDLRDTPQDCYACHAKDDDHNGGFGRQCEQCHKPTDWADATFDHTIFPVTHGREERVATCATCHPNGTTTYTCFGCHEHTPGNVLREHDGRSLASIANCIECHVGGREGDD